MYKGDQFRHFFTVLSLLLFITIFFNSCDDHDPVSSVQDSNSNNDTSTTSTNTKSTSPVIAKPIKLTPSSLSGKWAYITFDHDGCESISPPDYQIFNFSILASLNGQFSSMWGYYNVSGAIVNDTAILMVAKYNDYFNNTQIMRVVAAFQTAPSTALSGSVFSGYGYTIQVNATTGKVLCQGSYSFLMVRDFTKVGGSSTSSGSTYNPNSSKSPSLFRSDCYNDWLTCNKACSFDYMNTQPSSICSGRCDLEKAECMAR